MNLPCLRGIELRYVLAFHLANRSPATVGELIDAVNHQGFSFRGRPSKAVSDALWWEIERGRVHRLGRGWGSPPIFRARPNTGFTNACWPCGPQLSLRGGHNACHLSPETAVADVTRRLP
jgi:hypothetical protein